MSETADHPAVLETAEAETVRDAILAHRLVESVLQFAAVSSGDGVLIAARIAIAPGTPLSDVGRALKAIEHEVRTALPRTVEVYLQPDFYRPDDAAPATDVIVIKGMD